MVRRRTGRRPRRTSIMKQMWVMMMMMIRMIGERDVLLDGLAWTVRCAI